MSISDKQPADLLLRRASIADLPGIAEVEQLSFVHAGERFSESRVLGWTAGLVWLRGREPWGRIYALAVHPHARGKRLGPRLLNQMIQSLRDRGARRIFLEVKVDNDLAIRLYQAVGFRPCRLLNHYYGPDLHAQRMALPAAMEPSPAASP
jgi:ribosomal protein S18 acetylase RimI-like enzyme